MQLRRLSLTLTALALALSAACSSEPPPGGGPPRMTERPAPSNPGKTSFTSEDQNNPGSFGSGRPTIGGTGGTGGAGTGGAADNAAPPGAAPGKSESAPGGRMGDVQEGDIYKVAGTHLYYLNTYKGFIVYDIANPQKPVRISRLPVFGYPVEMFVEGTTIYALLSDSLYLTQTTGKLEFARHNVSQLVTIDISNPASPKVLKTLDIIGQLREGVARKIENTIYVVSYWNRNYWWGWGYEQADPQRQDQAWVYSFDVSNRESPQKTGELKVFEGGAVNYYDRVTGASFNRNFNGVYIAATANALMVVENWYIHSSGGYQGGRCGYYNSDQQSVVSLVDISDAKGAIRLHTRFETAGALTDQFKQTYTHDPVTKKGTYFGIFARRGWSSFGCNGEQHIQNLIEAWDVSDGSKPTRIGSKEFGKPNETVRGTAFDVDRQVAFAITAEQIDPLYAISIADPRNLHILSEIDGLSGDISVFRTVGANKKFLLAVGRDNSKSCVGIDSSRGENNIAVSLIDAQDLTNIRLVQRQCVKIENAAWVGSEVAWNLDQAHKMLGMHADGNLNVITVPVSYYTRSDTKEGWWYDRFQTAVGIMSWDLTRYDPAKMPAQQTVIQNHGTFVHPDGEVRRSVLFTHPTVKQRLMANLSDTHISLANIQDLTSPKLESIVEVAPYLNELFRFGDYIVEEVQPRVSNDWSWERSAVEFRVKRAGGDLDGATPVTQFLVGQVQTVVKHGNQLVIFRSFPETPTTTGRRIPGPEGKRRSEAVIYDLTDPTHPRLAGRVDVPQEAFPYYTFYCGGYWDGFWWGGYGGYWYGGSSWVDTAHGLVVARQVWDTNYTVGKWKLLFLDLRDIARPKVSERELNLGQNTHLTSLTVDTVDARGFYLGSRTLVGEVTRSNGAKFYQWKDWAARFDLVNDQWSQSERMNIPGRLIRTWRNPANERMLLTSDYVSEWREDAATKQSYWTSWSRLSLLREIDVNGSVAAELQDERTFKDISLASLTADGERLFVNGQRNGGYFYGGGYPVGDGVAVGGGPVGMGPRPDLSDRLMAFDLSARKLNLVYDQSTKMFNVQLMGVQDGRLFVNLAGDGILIVDVKDAAKPFGVLFSRTLGYATHIEFAGDDVYVGSGFFGTTHIDLRGNPTIVLD